MKENNKKYEQPKIVVITFKKEDIIRTSGYGNSYGGQGGDFWNPTAGDDFWK